jgi:hypothetical protein
MTLNTAGYTVGSNFPLNHARILYAPIAGTVTGGGTGAALAANDYTAQRWAAPSGVASWLLTTSAAVAVDTFFIAAHNLAGKTIRAMAGGASRTNFVPRSEEFDNAAWPKIQATVSANVLTAPNGTLTSDKIVENTANAEHLADNNSIGTLLAASYTVSIFVHESSERNIRFGAVHIGDTANVSLVNFNVGSKTFSNFAGRATVATSEDVGGGWWRVSIGFSITATRTVVMRVQTVSGVSTVYAGDGASGIFVWGAQLEAGTTATSYIRTTTAAVASDLYAVSPWITPPDNTTIAILTNNAGAPWQSTQFGIEVSEGAGVHIGIIRAGVALQMQQPFYAGHGIANWSRVTEAQQQFSETGQWLGRLEKRIALEANYSWAHLRADWYRANFEPFAKTLPLRPFGIAGNPSRMPDDVAWAWTSRDPRPINMGVRNMIEVSLPVTGYR